MKDHTQHNPTVAFPNGYSNNWKKMALKIHSFTSRIWLHIKPPLNEHTSFSRNSMHKTFQSSQLGLGTSTWQSENGTKTEVLNRTATANMCAARQSLPALPRAAPPMGNWEPSPSLQWEEDLPGLVPLPHHTLMWVTFVLCFPVLCSKCEHFCSF